MSCLHDERREARAALTRHCASSEPIALSVVIPAYNEAERLPPYLDILRNYLRTEFEPEYEVIVVDDGSRDTLSQRVGELSQDWPQLMLLTHEQNRGKGAAVRTGMLAARGALLLFTDADGATPIAEERKLRSAVEAGADLAVGSRAVDESSVFHERNWMRRTIGALFAQVMRGVTGLPIRDTQCGFKMFRRDVGERLFRLCDEDGYLFDLEILMLAAQFGYRIDEVAVSWREVPGSKVHLIRDSWRMLRGLFRIRKEVAKIAQPSS